MLSSHLIFKIFFSFSHCGHSLELAGWSAEQFTVYIWQVFDTGQMHNVQAYHS